MTMKTNRCTGDCAACGKCKGANLLQEMNDRKTKLVQLPEDFLPDRGEELGIAFDIGTTTVVGTLWDLSMGEHLLTQARTNPQNTYGADVISRINYCEDHPERFEKLRSLILQCLEDLASSLLKKAGRGKDQILRVVIAGNSTMSHIVTGHDPASLARSPFQPAYTGPVIRRGREMLSSMNPDGEVFVVPNIAGHVGGDITAGLIASRLTEKKDLVLFIDIGTNGEIVLTDGSQMLACSTAAGPAFEGAAIHQGMRAAAGAIEAVRIEEGTVFFRTIEERVPAGICGSGLIDAIAEMKKAGIINKSGRLLLPSDKKGDPFSPDIAGRLRETDGIREFVLVFREDQEDIVITQKDIREVQLAKGAIAAGISLMLQQVGRKAEEIQQVLVAGAFGNFIDKASAMEIGLLPDLPMERVESIGNAAGNGAGMVLLSKAERQLALEIPEITRHLELATCDNFQEEYLKAMSF